MAETAPTPATGPVLGVNDEVNVQALPLADIKEELSVRSLDVTGLKAELVPRLVAALKTERAAKAAASALIAAQPAKLFVGQVSAQTTEEKLREIFGPFGTIQEVVLLKDRVTQKHKGCGFVTFSSLAEAEAAIAGVHDQIQLPGAKRTLIVNLSSMTGRKNNTATPAPVSGGSGNADNKLYVGMLDRATTEEEMRALFNQYGSVEEVFLMKDNQNGGKSKGSGFVKFATHGGAIAAISALNGVHKDKDSPSVLQVRFAHSRQDKQQREQAKAGGVFGGNVMGSAWGQQAAGPYGAMVGMPPGANPYAAYGAYGQPPAPYYGQQDAAIPMGGMGGVMGGMMGGMPDMAGMYGGAMQAPSTGQAAAPAPPPPRSEQTYGPAGSNLFVYGIPDTYSDPDLNSLFSNFGNVISAKVQMDLSTGRSKGFGFVSFDTPPSAQAAISTMDGFVIGAKKLSVRLKKGEPGATSGTKTGYNPY